MKAGDTIIAEKFKKDNSLKSVTIATGDIFVTDLKMKEAIRKEFGADAVDMESAAIAQTAKRNTKVLAFNRSGYC